MNAIDVVKIIHLMYDYGLKSEARKLLGAIMKTEPKLIGPETLASLRDLIKAGHAGMPKGYRFDRVLCDVCGREVAVNWLLRHKCVGELSRKSYRRGE